MNMKILEESPAMWRTEYEEKTATVSDLKGVVSSGSCVYVESGCGEPQHLVKHLILENMKLCDVQVYTSVPLSAYSDFGGEYGSRFRIQSFFISPNLTSAFADGRADHLPMSSLGKYKLFAEGYITINTALIQLSPPDAKGFMSLGVTVDIMKSIIEKADMVVAQINRYMPVTGGDSLVHVKDVDYLVEFDEPLVSYPIQESDPEVMQVGKNIGRLIEDGATIQIGFGRIPDATLMFLKGKKDLRIHSEIVTDSVVDLAVSGAISRSAAGGRDAPITASLCIGSERVFGFVGRNSMVEMRDLSDIISPAAILSREKFTAINGAIEIDLTGQSCVGMGDQMGYFGALGHAVFNRTAMFSPGGKGIIALRSTSRDGSLSRIVPEFIDRKIGIVTTQSDVNYVVTEYGSVNLFGKSIRERALALITIAHPRFRQWLLDEAKRMNYIYEDQALPPEGADYPGSYEGLCLIRDKGLLVRPVKVTDERAVQNLFYAMSRDDRFHRFLMHVSSLHHKQAQDLVTVDYTSSMALVIQNGQGRQDEIIAVAHIAPEESRGTRKICEFAAMVNPSWQNQGIGSFLLRRMISVGRDLGYSHMRAYVWEDNRQMLKAFENLGCGMIQELDCHVYRVSLAID